jgi:hypothetical protein
MIPQNLFFQRKIFYHFLMKKLLTLILSSFTSFAATIVPFERDVTRIPRPTFLSSQYSDSGEFWKSFAGDEDDNLYYQGFSFQNSGPNKIVTTTPEGMDFPGRDFSFITDDHSRRDVYLWITDYNGSGYMSDLYETVLVFLPRNNQMHIEEIGEDFLITLPTSEEVTFSRKTRMITSGVLTEEALDFNPSRPDRKFAQVGYTGKGLVIRSDARASDPRLTKYSQVIKAGKKPCKVLSSLFWTKEGFPQFQFVSDDEVYSVISKHCGGDFLISN